MCGGKSGARWLREIGAVQIYLSRHAHRLCAMPSKWLHANMTPAQASQQKQDLGGTVCSHSKLDMVHLGPSATDSTLRLMDRDCKVRADRVDVMIDRSS